MTNHQSVLKGHGTLHHLSAVKPPTMDAYVANLQAVFEYCLGSESWYINATKAHIYYISCSLAPYLPPNHWIGSKTVSLYQTSYKYRSKSSMDWFRWNLIYQKTWIFPEHPWCTVKIPKKMRRLKNWRLNLWKSQLLRCQFVQTAVAVDPSAARQAVGQGVAPPGINDIWEDVWQCVGDVSCTIPCKF